MSTKEEYTRIIEEMCNKIVSCADCVLEEICGVCPSDGMLFDLLTILETWAEEHPKKTNREKFKEVFGITLPSIKSLGQCSEKRMEECINNGEIPCDDCEWWNEEYKEPAKEGDNE